MKNLTAKQKERLEKKKKKMSALAEMIKLNEKEKDNNNKVKQNFISSNNNNNKTDPSEILNDTNNLNNCEKKSKRMSEGNIIVEPKLKKQKLNNDEQNKDEENEEDIRKKLKNHDEIIIEPQEQQNHNLNTSITKIIKNSNAVISDEEYNILKREINEKKRLAKQVPKYRLREFGEYAKLSVEHENRTPIFLTDIQHLLMAALIGPESPCTPARWCSLQKINKLTHSVVLIVEGISLFHYLSYEKQFSQTSGIFEDKLEIVLPTHKESKILQELVTVPLTNAQKTDLITKYGSLEVAIEMNKDPTFMVKTVFPITGDDETNTKNDIQNLEENKISDKFPRTKLLLSALQMVDEGYPLPLRGELEKKYKHYTFTKSEYTKVTPNSPLYGVDCEMCRTSLGINELTRISIVNEELQTVYESLVRPTNRIVDYLTKYSGITAEMMMNVTKHLQQVQNDVQNLLPADAILVGQSLNADLHAMQMMHPYVIDTSVIFNLTGERRRKTKLQVLAKKFLGEIIQVNLDGHDSVEDSLASIKLTKLKLENGLDFGDAVLQGKTQRQEINKEKLKITNNLFACVSVKTEKTSAIVTAQELSDDVKQDIECYKINCNDTESTNIKTNSIRLYKTDGNKAAIHKVKEVMMDNALTIANVNIAPQQLELSRIEKSISNIDKWIGKLYNSLAHHGLFVVIFGGSPGSTSGVAMLKIKRNSSNSSSDTSDAT